MIDLKGKKRAWRDCTNSLHAFFETFLSLQAHAEGPSSSACRWIAHPAEMCPDCFDFYPDEESTLPFQFGC